MYRSELIRNMADLTENQHRQDRDTANVTSKFRLLHNVLQLCYVECDMDTLKHLLDNTDEETICGLMRQTLDHVEDIEGISFSGTLLQFAIYEKNPELTRYFIQLKGHDLEYDYGNLGTPLIYACLMDDVEAAQELLKFGVDPNHASLTTSPLINAATHGGRMVNILIEAGANINMGRGSHYAKSSSLSFYLACIRGNIIAAEAFLTVLKKADELPISVEQMILCQTILAIQLIKYSSHLQVGLSLWRKALEWFTELMQPRFGVHDRDYMSRRLLELYIRESVLVQSGKCIKINVPQLLKRSLSRFLDFKLCVFPDDITDDIHVGDAFITIHEAILMSCISEMSAWWAYHGMTLFICIRNIVNNDITVEIKRLCLLLVLEIVLHIDQSMHILSVNCNILLPTITRHRLHAKHPGYVMLIMDIIIDACRNTFEALKNVPLALKCTGDERVNVMNTAYFHTSKTIGALTFLALYNNPSSSQLSHLTKLVHTFVDLCKEMENQDEEIFMQYPMINEILTYTVSHNPLDLFDDNDDDNDDQDIDYREKCVQLVVSLLRCGLDPNARSVNGDTAMFTVLLMSEPYRSDVMELMMSYGAHVDIQNKSGDTPYKLLCEATDCRVHPLVCRTLKCRAASVISHHNVPYQQILPSTLTTFVALHQR